MAHNLTLVTDNVRYFQRVDGLRLTNWTVYPERQIPGSSAG